VADTYQLSAELLKAIIKIESNYNPRAVSPKGAQGLMQLMPATAKRFGVSDVFDPEENIIGGVKFLRYLFNEFGENNLELVLAGYNAGEEAVRKYGNKIPPYAETRQYVKKVLALYLPTAKYKHTKSGTIYRYVGKNGVVTFTNIPRVN
jgi:soluble lytic murein transglycosylase-like protein